METFKWVQKIDNPNRLYITLIITFGVAFFLGIATALKTNWGSLFLPSFATFIAAFVGPLLAFRKDRNDAEKAQLKLDKKQQQEREQAINHANFVMTRFYEVIHEIYIEASKYPDWKLFSYNFPPKDPVDSNDIKLDFESLSFLYSYDPNLLSSIWFSIKQYEQTVKAVRFRNEYHVKKFSFVFQREQARGKDSQPTDEEVFELRRVMTGIEQASNEVLKMLPKSHKSVRNSVLKLHQACKTLFPDSAWLVPEFKPLDKKPPQPKTPSNKPIS